MLTKEFQKNLKTYKSNLSKSKVFGLNKAYIDAVKIRIEKNEANEARRALAKVTGVQTL